MKKKICLALACLTLSAYGEQICHDNYNATTPVGRFTLHADNTVTDKRTGLTWMRCTLGQTGKDCSGGSAKKLQWQDALVEIKNNHPGWRLPDANELAFIVERRCVRPAIVTAIFPKTPDYGHYWSSSLHAEDDTNVWVVDSYDGKLLDDFKDSKAYVRLVRDTK